MATKDDLRTLKEDYEAFKWQFATVCPQCDGNLLKPEFSVGNPKCDVCGYELRIPPQKEQHNSDYVPTIIVIILLVLLYLYLRAIGVL